MTNTYQGRTFTEMPSGWLSDAIDGLHAYDTGCVDSGVHDEELRRFVQEHIASLDRESRRYVLSVIMRDLYLSSEALILGYGWEDARALGEWYDEQFGVG